MKLNRTVSRLMLLPMLALVGFLLMYLPGKFLEQYEVVARAGAFWVVVYFTVVGAGGVLLLGSTGWIAWRLYQNTRRKQARRARRDKDPSQLTVAERAYELDENLAQIARLETDPNVDSATLAELKPMIERLEEKRESATLEIVAFGTISSGKSSLLNALAGRDVFVTDARGGTTARRNEIPWPTSDKVTLVDTPGLGEIEGELNQHLAAECARDADIVLVVVDGPLRHSEHVLLEQLGRMEKRVLICLNKLDWYEETDRMALLGQITDQAKQYVRAEDVVAVQSRGARRERVRVLSGGEERREMVESPPDIDQLANRLLRIFKADARELLMANLLLRSRGLVENARERAQAALDARAWKLVDRYMWGAGSAAALSPFPVLDIAAGSAISIKMILDLGRVYRQPIDVDTAVRMVGELGKCLISIVGANALTSVGASVLKAAPGIGTVAGGALQGVVQAVVTRWIGAVFIEYFKHEMQTPEGGLSALARRQWEHVTSAAEIRRMVDVARRRLLSRDDQEEDDA